MRARRVVVAGPRQVRVEPFGLDTGGLGPDEVVVRTLVTLVSPGTEGAGFRGLKAPGQGVEPTFPSGLGYASVGEVTAVGGAVTAVDGEAPVAVGDVVFTTTPHASAARVDTRRQLCVPVPVGLAPERAVFARLATVAMATLSTTAAPTFGAAAVVGLGLVGNLAAQLCAAAGRPVTGIDLLPGRCATARRVGIPEVLEAPSPDALRAEHALVLECTGTAEGALAAVALTRPGGELALVGAPFGRGNAAVPAHGLLEGIFAGYVRVRSSWEWQLPTFPAPSGAGSHEENSRRALAMIADGRLRVDELISHRLPPDRAQEAYEGLVDDKDRFLGVVFDWGSDAPGGR